MDDRFEQEFYVSEWRRVLPIGPDGIQPYVRTSRRSGRRAGLLHRLAPTLRALAQGLNDVREGLGAFGSFGRWGATGGTVHARLARATRSGETSSLATLRGVRRATAATSPAQRKAA